MNEDNADKLVTLQKAREAREIDAATKKLKDKSVSEDRAAFLALENDICQLATAAEIAQDILMQSNTHVIRKVHFLVDEIESLAVGLREKYYGRTKKQDD
jgi:hypothetical protein